MLTGSPERCCRVLPGVSQGRRSGSSLTLEHGLDPTKLLYDSDRAGVWVQGKHGWCGLRVEPHSTSHSLNDPLGPATTSSRAGSSTPERSTAGAEAEPSLRGLSVLIHHTFRRLADPKGPGSGHVPRAMSWRREWPLSWVSSFKVSSFIHTWVNGCKPAAHRRRYLVRLLDQ